MFYTHVSDQYAPFHIKAINATAHQAPYVLDGLLYHETELQIAEHYTDTGGVTLIALIWKGAYWSETWV